MLIITRVTQYWRMSEWCHWLLQTDNVGPLTVMWNIYDIKVDPFLLNLSLNAVIIDIDTVLLIIVIASMF